MENWPVQKTAVLIIGGGAAGYTAAIYAGRASLNPILVQGPEPGGQLTLTTEVENYPGFSAAIQGPWLMEEMAKQAENCGAMLIHDTISRVNFKQYPFQCWGGNTLYEAESVIVCTGAQAKWLGLESESFFRGYGVSSCAVCDGFFFRQKKVIVVGGGNTAAESALFLARQCQEVILVHRGDHLRAEKTLQHKVLSLPNITILWNHVVETVQGTSEPKKVTGAQVRHVQTGEHREILADGIFIAIGHSPTTQIFQGVLNLDAEGYIVPLGVAPHTEIPGIFAAGDVQDKVYRQAITAAGQGCMAALEAERFLTTQS